MFGFFNFGLPGLIVMAAALIHFVRRQPDSYWLWIILLLGPLGSLIYLATQALPELRDPGTFKFVGRKSRIRELEFAVSQNPSAGNYEELGQLYLDAGKWAKARACFDRSLAQRKDSPDPFYRRALAELQLGDFAAVVQDLEPVVRTRPDYDIHRAAGLLAWAYARTGKNEQAEALFARLAQLSTLTETQLHYAEFLAAQGRRAEARRWAERILAKRAGMPGFQRRHERPYFRQARALLRIRE
ncbi:MAG: hypothetical protein ABSD88_11245 [Candidatus Korobacteraceae bacterium]|jgi:hypothetical protein